MSRRKIKHHPWWVMRGSFSSSATPQTTETRATPEIGTWLQLKEKGCYSVSARGKAITMKIARTSTHEAHTGGQAQGAKNGAADPGAAMAAIARDTWRKEA